MNDDCSKSCGKTRISNETMGSFVFFCSPRKPTVSSTREDPRGRKRPTFLSSSEIGSCMFWAWQHEFVRRLGFLRSFADIQVDTRIEFKNFRCTIDVSFEPCLSESVARPQVRGPQPRCIVDSGIARVAATLVRCILGRQPHNH